MSESSTQLAAEIVNQLDAIVKSCQENTRPLELDPARGEIFELFVKANRAGLTQEEAEPELTADALCEILADRWGLKTAAQQSVVNETSIPATNMAQMRSLWSVMRMWMEWTYAWDRWSEYH